MGGFSLMRGGMGGGGYGPGGYSYNPYGGGAGGAGGMVGLDQLLKLLQGMQGGGPGGMNAPNAAGATNPARFNPGGFGSATGIGPQARGFGGNSLAPSVLGAPAVTQPGDQSGVNNVAPAAAGGTVPMGNLLSLSPGQVQGRSRMNQRGNPFGQGYGGGLARPQRSSWSPQGQQGPRVFSMTAQ